MGKKGGKDGIVLANPISYSLLKDMAIENRKMATDAETVMWNCLTSTFHNVRFRRQFIIDEYIVDFIALKKKLIIEIDGGYHFTPEQAEKDSEREQRLMALGFKVIRFTNEQVIGDIDGVIKTIKTELW